MDIIEIEKNMKTILEDNEDRFGRFSEQDNYAFFVSNKTDNLLRKGWDATMGFKGTLAFKGYSIFHTKIFPDNIIFFGKIYRY